MKNNKSRTEISRKDRAGSILMEYLLIQVLVARLPMLLGGLSLSVP